MEAPKRTVLLSSPLRGRSVSPRAASPSSLSSPSYRLRSRRASALCLLAAGALAALAMSHTLHLRMETTQNQRGLSVGWEYLQAAVGSTNALSTPQLPGLPASVSSHALPSAINRTNTTVPHWMKDYFAWHAATRRALTPHNYRNGTARFLVLRCLREDPKCGGAADRLKGLPFFLLIAHQTQRLLLIDWTRPHKLEEFLVPPFAGDSGELGPPLDWTVPPWMAVQHAPREVLIDTRQVLQQLLDESHPTSRRTFVDLRHQSHDYGMGYYDDHARRRNEPSFQQVYPTVWSAVFAPSPAVRRRVLQHPLFQQPQAYVTLHIRTLYARNASAHARTIHNAVHCAYQLAANRSLARSPLLVATDSLVGTRTAVAYAARFFPRVYGRTDPHHPPLHLDRGMDFLDARRRQRQQGGYMDNDTTLYWDQHAPSAFYAVFVDLYLLAGGACHTYGLGGFGRWGAELSTHPECVFNHAVRGQQCPIPTVPLVASTA